MAVAFEKVFYSWRTRCRAKITAGGRRASNKALQRTEKCVVPFAKGAKAPPHFSAPELGVRR